MVYTEVLFNILRMTNLEIHACLEIYVYVLNT